MYDSLTEVLNLGQVKLINCKFLTIDWNCVGSYDLAGLKKSQSSISVCNFELEEKEHTTFFDSPKQKVISRLEWRKT